MVWNASRCLKHSLPHETSIIFPFWKLTDFEGGPASAHLGISPFPPSSCQVHRGLDTVGNQCLAGATKKPFAPQYPQCHVCTAGICTAKIVRFLYSWYLLTFAESSAARRPISTTADGRGSVRGGRPQYHVCTAGIWLLTGICTAKIVRFLHGRYLITHGWYLYG